ncbi:MAG TPA: hypothetical protein VHN14_23095 [Kofleriaceae bacterium]|jgi:hypothetical protein|nr:hypothetical protein [Kofleriaceae bacterium]
MATYDFERWSVYKNDMFVGDIGFSVTVPRNFNNAYVMRLAGEWQKLPFLPQLTARAGILRSISDQPKGTVSPSLTDGNSWAVSLGAGYNITPGLCSAPACDQREQVDQTCLDAPLTTQCSCHSSLPDFYLLIGYFWIRFRNK